MFRADFEDGGLEDALSELDESAADVDAGAVPATVYETAAGLYEKAANAGYDLTAIRPMLDALSAS